MTWHRDYPGHSIAAQRGWRKRKLKKAIRKAAIYGAKKYITATTGVPTDMGDVVEMGINHYRRIHDKEL